MKHFLLSATALVALSATSFAADLPKKNAAPVAPAAYSWSGAYVGGTIGYGAQATRDDDGKAHSTGFAGGLLAGYNFQNGNIVYGVEADISGAGLTGHTAESGSTTYATRMIASLRGRAGIAFDRTLVYGTAGLSFVSGKITSDETARNVNALGYVVGAGVEHALTNTLSIRAEGLYHGYSKSVSFDGETVKVKNALIGRVGFSVKF